MAGRLTLWGAGQLLTSFFGRTSEPPANFYLALCRDIQPTPYVSGAELDEPSIDDGYQRVVIPNAATTWAINESVLHVISNDYEAAFVQALADWGRISYWALCNAETDGYVYLVGEIEEELFVTTGDELVMGADELTVELGPFFSEEDF